MAMCAALDRVRVLLRDRDEEFSRCESSSLRLEKYVRIGGNTKKEEIDAVVSKTPQKVPPFKPSGAVTFTAKLGGRLIVNQAGGVLENAGLCLHPHFNAPYIPGSALKGVARHAAWSAWNEEADPEMKSALAKEIADIFGYPTNDRGLDDYLAGIGYNTKHSGSVCFMPAYPETTAKLVTDILTPHGGNDWTTPVPSPFPAVEQGTIFLFGVCQVASGSPCGFAVKWLKRGLCEHGIGAKTNAGYGRFAMEGVSGQHDAIVMLNFSSPAFLRGAEGDEGRLRIATLRGLMRWWWRWIYSSVLSERDLKALEKKVWGGCDGTASASCIALSLASERVMSSEPYNKEAMTPRNRQQQLRTTGLAYLSYGMDERVRGEARRRCVLNCHTANVWQLAIDVNSRDTGLSREQLLSHAKLALWALCNYGGVGAKSRKGFGSLCCDINYADISVVFGEVGASLANSGLEMLEDDATAPYAMTTSIIDSVKTRSHSPWFVLDRIGYALQCVASDYKHNEDKAVMGLPRKIHGPRRDPMPHQKGFHRPPQELKADSANVGDRFSSPLSIHLKDVPDGIEVNLTAFPSGLVRDREISESILGECIDKIKAVLGEI